MLVVEAGGSGDGFHGPSSGGVNVSNSSIIMIKKIHRQWLTS